MASERTSVDELLARQSEPAKLLVTVEAVESNETLVLVTPYVAGLGCQCSHALKVKKQAIEWLAATDEVHECCGKRLIVTEIGFADATLTDVVSQLAQAARETGRRREPTPDQQFRSGFPRPSMRGRTSVQAAPTRRRRSIRPNAFLAEFSGGPEQFGSPDELGSGFLHRPVCELYRYTCKLGCGQTYFDDPRGLECCNCQCDEDFYSCLDPRYRQLDCCAI